MTMTWEEFKKSMDEKGVRDDDRIGCIDTYGDPDFTVQFEQFEKYRSIKVW